MLLESAEVRLTFGVFGSDLFAAGSMGDLGLALLCALLVVLVALGAGWKRVVESLLHRGL